MPKSNGKKILLSDIKSKLYSDSYIEKMLGVILCIEEKKYDAEIIDILYSYNDEYETRLGRSLHHLSIVALDLLGVERYLGKDILITHDIMTYRYISIEEPYRPISIENAFELLKKEKKLENNILGPIFAIYKYYNDYIIYGEIEIARVDADFNLKWKYSGKDIFVRNIGKEPAFILKKDMIILYDFLGNKYNVSYEGKTINFIPQV